MGPSWKALISMRERFLRAQCWLNGLALKHRWALILWLVFVMGLAFVLPAAGVPVLTVVPLLLGLVLLPWFRVQRGHVTLLVGPCFKRGGAACEVHMMGVKSPLALRRALRDDLPRLLGQLHQEGIASVQFRSILLAKPEHLDLFSRQLESAMEARDLAWRVRSQEIRVSEGDAFAFWLMHVAPAALSAAEPDAWRNRPRNQAGKALCGVVVVG